MPDTAAVLSEIEAIKQLKARYCRYLDTKRWDDWRQLFTSSATPRRLREDVFNPLFSVRISPRLRHAGAVPVRRFQR